MTNTQTPTDEADFHYMRRAIQLALEAEERGNLPVGAVVTLNGEVVAEAGNSVLVPIYDPGRHAEVEALARVPASLWPRSREMTVYTTLEPCVMCAGAALLHGLGRVVFGALDHTGGAGELLAHLPRYYEGGAGVPLWMGPLMPELCDPLLRRVLERFDALPCGKSQF
ncbi:MAG: haloalkane dehalogenase [Acidobacteriota bacterium]|jgi:tRNA(adenine34) deaminase|nr:haloalkane dehalogenase [Acidobacteriota bacterium]MDT7781397.1 haloalkane dehalogenase [Acidobacteriota bacterium]